jgi:Glycosyl hydrolase family 26
MLSKLKRIPARLAAPIVLLVGLVAPSPEAIGATAGIDVSAPATGTYLGAYVQPEGWSQQEVMDAIEGREQDMGRTYDVGHLFYQWNANIPTWKESWDLESGRIPMISWRGTYTSTIVNGSQDGWIRSRAEALAALDGTVLLRWFAEMDGDPWEDEIGTPAQFISAWRRMHGIFVSEGATNVEWVWCPNAYAWDTGEAPGLYPGDAYVDWICADGFNWSPGRPGVPWTSFAEVFDNFYAWADPKNKPILIGETGSEERNPGEKAQWITDMGTTIKTIYPEIKALVYFDAESTSNQGGWYDWRVDTSTSSYAAFQALAADPHFNPGGGGGGIPVFSDGFESGNMSNWTSSTGISVQQQTVRSGTYAARAMSTGSIERAYEVLDTSYTELFAAAGIRIASQGANSVYLLRFRTAGSVGIVSLYVTGNGYVGLYNDTTGQSYVSFQPVSLGTWHWVELHARVAGAGSLVEVWFNGIRLPVLSLTVDLGTTAIKQVQIGDHATGRTYDVYFDDVNVSTGFIPSI